MENRIEILSEKKLIDKSQKMTYSTNHKTVDLWRGFMQRRKEITNSVSTDLYSMQVYDSDFDFQKFNLNAEFEKWATTEVSDFDNVPEGMNTFILRGGLYAVFIHKGDASTAAQTFQYIFGTWLPNSDYVLDDRPHFEIIGEKYKRDSSDSEEEVWIPIKMKE